MLLFLHFSAKYSNSLYVEGVFLHHFTGVLLRTFSNHQIYITITDDDDDDDDDDDE